MWRRVGEQLGAGMKKHPIVDQDKFKGEWVALDPKMDAVLSHSRSFDVEGWVIEQGTTTASFQPPTLPFS